MKNFFETISAWIIAVMIFLVVAYIVVTIFDDISFALAIDLARLLQ